MKQDKQNDLIQNKEEIKELLEAEIVSRYYFQAGKIDYNNHHDPDVKEAINILNNAAKYKELLGK